jgi:hypothetical protein
MQQSYMTPDVTSKTLYPAIGAISVSSRQQDVNFLMIKKIGWSNPKDS